MMIFQDHYDDNLLMVWLYTDTYHTNKYLFETLLLLYRNRKLTVEVMVRTFKPSSGVTVIGQSYLWRGYGEAV